jgi:hypothetical protein
MSSYTRHRFPLYQIQCPVTPDIVFRCARSKVELHSTSLSAVPGPLSGYTRHRFPLLGPKSSYTRHRFLLYQVQCRVTLDIAFCYTRYNVEYNRHRFALYQIQCPVTHDIVLRCTRSNVELHSTVRSAIPGPVSSSNRQLVYSSAFRYCQLDVLHKQMQFLPSEGHN